MTDKGQADALTSGAIATMREHGWSEQQIEVERRNAERIKAAGGFSNWVKMNEAARIASEARGYSVEPESFTVAQSQTAADELAEIAGQENLGMPPTMWAYCFGMEHVERNTGAGYPVLTPSQQCTLRTVVEGQIMRAFEAQADTLPLRQVPSGLQWPKGQALPLKWREGMYLTKTELRAWGAKHCPDLLGSALLAAPAPESAPAERAATIAGPGKMGHCTKGKRAQPLAAEIEAARREATNPDDAHAVFAVLQRWAENGKAPFIGFVQGEGCKYQTPGGTVAFFAISALLKRMSRAANARERPLTPAAIGETGGAA